MSDPGPFDVCGDLPRGTIVLEASAGTGKTFTIAALAARYVAEGRAALGELMLVTFGRMASNELRSRVRERLVSLERRLGEQTAGPAPDPGRLDALERLLTGCDRDELVRRQQRVSAALSDFDAATIATTHEFCQRMQDGLGVLGDRDPDAMFVEKLTDLTRDVATDQYLRRYANDPRPPLTVGEALDIAQRAIDAPHARLVPSAAPAGGTSSADERVAFATSVRAELEQRKRSNKIFTYDDMLTRLRDALADPRWGDAAADRLRRRYQVVMVDEFQDTDPIQWEILRRAFHGHTTLVLIGDPKQAIYAFRGADVFSYLQAQRDADQVSTLATNWRSDAALVDALDTVMGGAALGDEQIVVRPVTARYTGRRLLPPRGTDGPAGSGRSLAPLRIRVIEQADDRRLAVATIRPRIVEDLVADVCATLASGARLDRRRLPGRAGGSTSEGPRTAGVATGTTSEVQRDGRLRPSDIAVLVRKNERGEAIRDALVAAGVPAVMVGASSVFASAVAQHWLTLLTALDQPRQQHVRQAALTCFFGWTFEQLARSSERELVDLSQQVRSWSRILAGRGVAALLEAATAEEHVPERLLATRGGERTLTDLRHLGEILNAAMTSGPLGVGALADWLRARIAEDRANASTEMTRRLETDAEAVTILTLHRSKGLEFPVVYLPEAWDRFVRSADEQVLLLHQDAAAPPQAEARPQDHLGSAPPNAFPTFAESVLDVGGRRGAGRAERAARFLAEEAGEDLRLFYVAVTRAQCQVVTWWAPSANTEASALHRFLSRAPGDTPALRQSYPLTGDPFSGRSLGPLVALEAVEPRPGAGTPTAQGAPPLRAQPLHVRRFDRFLDLSWRRTSYSSLTASVHGSDGPTPAVSSEPELHWEDDEPSGDAAVRTGEQGAGIATPPSGEAPAQAGLDRPSPMAEMPTGAQFGTAVHAVFEAVDPGSPDLEAALRRACEASLARSSTELVRPEALAASLLPAYGTPLGPLAGERRLCDFPRADMLAELAFELPLRGSAESGLARMGGLLRRHLPATDPLLGYADLLDDPVLAGQSLRGYLTGSIDLTLRVRDGASPRYLVVDYKTNWLGGFDGQPLTLGDYTPPRMAAAMLSAHYPLQALLYSVAVHRMLRWRQPGYDPAVHLGGVLYLFVRGMAGPDTPRIDGVPCGVFSWRPPAALVLDLSELLDGVGHDGVDV